MNDYDAVKAIALILGLIVGIVIAGVVTYDSSQSVSTETAEPRQGLPPHVQVFEYKEATCFMSNNIDGEGITCMPTKQVEG